MQRFIRAGLFIAGIVSIISALVRRVGPRVQEYTTASQEFWADPKVARARQQAWAHAQRMAQAKGGPKVAEYATATQEFWANPKVVKARRQAWEHARRMLREQAARSGRS
ncbi:hypothetical protein EDM22_15145 [Agromyces tardus]|jgi:dihydrodipicolinate synthase/N-acetylneuraminate lyase|uniref:Uncharacterized protein n=1 Tax=Agromyces tardus TaxID=2583849 RepID=A0A3M8A3W8_9MICO|nr:hypothetical protein [Agromyces tardus]RNB45918.1 hypothetical protein EDM22_15145 [Agromyces tardus]